jgi:hypothetical protein
MDEIREVDRRNGNAARARKQAAKQAESAGVVEDEAGNVHRLKATSLMIPEERRCTAMTVRGTRCKVGRMRGLEVCIFHSHLALEDDTLAALVDQDAKPRLSPRRALQHVVQLRAEQLAQAAVGGALDSTGKNATSAVISLLDAVDPLVTEGSSVTLTRQGMQDASYAQLRQVFGQPEHPPNGALEPF